jgi:hypothetical protein
MSKNTAYAAAEAATELRDDPSEWVRNWSQLIDDHEVLAVLNRADNVLDEPVEETRMGREIIEMAATETVDRATRDGNVSQLKALTGLTNQSENKERFFTEVGDRLTYEGAVGLCFGSPGSGKTSVILDAANVWRAITGGTVIANINWGGADAQFASDEEMLELMASYQGPVLALLDEIAQELSGFGTGSKKAEAFSDALLFIRKREKDHGPYAKRGSVLAVAHTRTKTAKEIRRVASFAVEKPDKTRPHMARILESEGGKDEWQELATFQGITDTAETYDEYQASEFQVSADYDADNSEDEQKPDDWAEKVERALRLHLVDDWTQEDAAQAVGYSKTWVTNRVSEYRDGDLDVTVDELESEVPQADD